MADIVLATLNAKYPHASLGLRYLAANLGPLRDRCRVIEFNLDQRAADMAEALLAEQPRMLGLGVYLWNVSALTELLGVLKRVAPDLPVVLGGPEVSFPDDPPPITALADYVIGGEADLALAGLCRELVAGRRPPGKFLAAPPPALEQVALPYHGYDRSDLANRILYVETARGCPFACEFCLSSLNIPVRFFPLGPLLVEFARLLDQGALRFKFVDRTFNLDLDRAQAVLEFFRTRYRPGLFLHFEVTPNRWSDPLRALVSSFPPGALQFEVGVQTFNPAVAAGVRRRESLAAIEPNLRWLRTQTGVHLHADLLVGLPGETLESLAAGFDRLLAVGPHEIQVGLLKRLRGTPLARRAAEAGLVFSPNPPYEILGQPELDFSTLQRLRRFARYWDLVANSGQFLETAPALWQGLGSAFNGFLRWSDWLFARWGRQHHLALVQLAESLFEYLVTVLGHDPAAVAQTLIRDYRRGGHTDTPPFLRPYPSPAAPAGASGRGRPALKRQALHANS